MPIPETFKAARLTQVRAATEEVTSDDDDEERENLRKFILPSHQDIVFQEGQFKPVPLVYISNQCHVSQIKPRKVMRFH